MIRTAFPFALLSLSVIGCSGSATPPAPEADGSIISEDGLKLVPVGGLLEFPWGIAELPNGALLVTEREGRLRLIENDTLIEAPVSGLPDDILVAGQGGLLGIKLASDFTESRRLYLSYSQSSGETNTTAVISATLSEDNRALSDVTEIFTGEPRETTFHYGSRIEELSDGTLIVTLGDGYRYMDSAQDTATLHGKIARINPDGSVPADNPLSEAQGLQTIYSYGHRNVQGLVYDADRGILWAHEHGPKGGDELNKIEPGKNYGWPEVTFGINYDGTIITEDTEGPGLEPPLVKWVPSIAPSGMALVQTAGFEAWQGDLLIGAMNGPRGQKLVRVDIDDSGTVVGTEDLLEDLRIPFRDVISTPTAIYLATADLDGALYRLELSEPGN